ncbi:C5 [callitrichine gammaherpesvirus 3]|uniref:C5 n=1 Tax=callitrichine gammaherpesvirus 3 TaxID=106331 RepID=Q8BEN0_9GAMA|nr:C5 [callitrichine gammaherpesvirus 3]AAN64287.1 C5 [callitrichine gammaherpesvirus 3]
MSGSSSVVLTTGVTYMLKIVDCGGGLEVTLRRSKHSDRGGTPVRLRMSVAKLGNPGFQEHNTKDVGTQEPTLGDPHNLSTVFPTTLNKAMFMLLASDRFVNPQPFQDKCHDLEPPKTITPKWKPPQPNYNPLSAQHPGVNIAYTKPVNVGEPDTTSLVRSCHTFIPQNTVTGTPSIITGSSADTPTPLADANTHPVINYPLTHTLQVSPINSHAPPTEPLTSSPSQTPGWYFSPPPVSAQQTSAPSPSVLSLCLSPPLPSNHSTIPFTVTHHPSPMTASTSRLRAHPYKPSDKKSTTNPVCSKRKVTHGKSTPQKDLTKKCGPFQPHIKPTLATFFRAFPLPDPIPTHPSSEGQPEIINQTTVTHSNHNEQVIPQDTDSNVEGPTDFTPDPGELPDLREVEAFFKSLQPVSEEPPCKENN